MKESTRFVGEKNTFSYSGIENTWFVEIIFFTS